MPSERPRHSTTACLSDRNCTGAEPPERTGNCQSDAALQPQRAGCPAPAPVTGLLLPPPEGRERPRLKPRAPATEQHAQVNTLLSLDPDHSQIPTELRSPPTRRNEVGPEMQSARTLTPASLPSPPRGLHCRCCFAKAPGFCLGFLQPADGQLCRKKTKQNKPPEVLQLLVFAQYKNKTPSKQTE